MSKKYHIVYETKNLVNGKTYIGVHSTNNLNDGYIGNGVYRQSDADRYITKAKKNVAFIHAVVEYGYENFSRMIYGFYDTRKEALEEEKYIVNKKWIEDRNNYNLSTGGLGRSGFKRNKEHTQLLNEIHSKEYVVVNIKTNEVFHVKNLTGWCRDNYPELAEIKENGKDYHKLNGVLKGACKLYNKTWWACRKEDWTGKVILKTYEKDKGEGIKKYPYRVVKDGKIYEGVNRAEFCREHNLDKSVFNKVIKGEVKSHKGFYKL